MDSLTQIVLGAAVGEAVLGKKVGNKAMLWGAIAGTIPDLDVLAQFFTDDLTKNELHRGFSHSILFSVIFAPLFGWLIYKIYKSNIASWTDWSKLMFWGFFTHPLLDAHTTWGTQLFWPFDLRIAYKNIFVVDPLYTLPFLVFLILAMFQKRTNHKRSKYNNLGLYVSSAYMVVTILLKGITFMKFENALKAQGIAYTELATRPAPFSTILWSAHVDTEKAYYIAYYSFFDDKAIKFNRIEKNRSLTAELEKEEAIQRLIKLSAGWYLIHKEGETVVFSDLRFGQMSFDTNNKDFVFRYDLTRGEDGKLKAKESMKRPDMGKMFNALGKRTFGIK